ncbi:MAG: 1-deoxy-D-xylulose-5-phosphate reductoisomerase [Candidatus Eremiobacteraeota bacterium]|nr:1-deoxy-D-xylulose-5-phosphate reductoisomerase [Candidatus Eremiobacteraeota bacterium]
MTRRRKVAILGSTGSIGTQALDVIAASEERFEVVGLAAGKNSALLAQQAERFGVRITSTSAQGIDGLRRVAIESKPDVVLAATDGFVAFDVAFAVVERGIDLAVANKELVVAAGELLMRAARKSGSQILPVDSEHSAVFQCLIGEDRASVQSIILTASGGPFWHKSAADLRGVTVQEALAHPTWQMGVKNTIDSATMMNKGLEMIEAARLFDTPPSSIHMLVHPQSIAHGAVIFTDGSVKAQLAAPDMRVPIGYALAYPARIDTGRVLDPLEALGGNPGSAAVRYEFERADPVRFPCVRLAYEAAKQGGTAPAVLSAANEIAVQAFVGGQAGFSDIPLIIEKVMRASGFAELTMETVREADRRAREMAREAVAALHTPAEVK